MSAADRGTLPPAADEVDELKRSMTELRGALVEATVRVVELIRILTSLETDCRLLQERIVDVEARAAE
jgi:hypothetical protein